ncbi:MAG: DNA-binding protein, partial [Methylococcaceae bacterium]|nr:DNA-binding protein [Methylococcaceae bacterium]
MAIERIVTDETVFEIADQLTANGEKVTNRAVWSAIGGGSMTTISQALRRWKERQVLQVTQPIERTPLPASLVDVLHNAATQLWDAALAETKSELEQLAQATNARIAEAQSERDDTLAELQTTAEELEQVKAERDAAQAEIDSKAQQLANRTAELATLQTELNAQTLASTQATHRAETAEAARTELLARVEQLTSLLTGEQTARHQAETDANALRSTLAKQTAEREASDRRAADIETRAIAEISAIKAERQELQTMLKTLMDKIGTVKDNSQLPNPQADRQNEDLFSDISE